MPAVKWNTELYDKQHHFVYQYGEGLIEWLAPRQGERILDLGSGTGELASKIAETGAAVTGIDASTEMVAKAQDKFPDIKFLAMDATALSFPEKFDGVFSNATLHWINKQQEALQCVFDVLREGGRFVFEMGGRHNIENIHRAIRQEMEDAGLATRLSRQENYFPSVAEQCSLLENVGFSVVNVSYFKRPTPLDGEDGMRLWIMQFCGFFFEGMDDQLRQSITGKAVERLRQSNYRSGQWTADYVRLRVKAIKENG
jgi:trans-aconitate methyltransferase